MTCSRTETTANVSNFSRWISGTRYNSCTWWCPRDLPWLGPPRAFSCHAKCCCSDWDQDRWCGVGWQLGSCAALRLGCPTMQTNYFVDALKGTPQAMVGHGVLLWWSTLGLKLAFEKGSFGPRAVWIGTPLEINAKVNKTEVRLPVKKNQEILEALAHVMDSTGGMVRHHEVRRMAGKVSWVASFLPQLKPFVRQLWASLYTCHWS